MHNNLIDNSSDSLSMRTYIKKCILAEGIDKIQIATGYWDIPGMALVLSELTSFLERDGTSLELLIGKDPVVYTSLLANPKYKDASYPDDFIRTDIHDLKIKDEYKSVINLLLQYCAFTKAKIFHYYELPIKACNQAEQQKVIDVVDEILSIKKSTPSSNVESLEKCLNDMIYKLYNLTDEEIMEVEDI